MVAVVFIPVHNIRLILAIACLVVGAINGAEKTEKVKTDPHRIPVREGESLFEKQKKDEEAALARLPPLDADRIESIVNILRSLKYPISIEDLRTKIGGPDSLVWCYMHVQGTKWTDSFLVAKPETDTGSYQLVVDYEEYSGKARPTSIGRARLCYESPLGWRFVAESLSDITQVGVPKNKTSPPSQPRPDSDASR